MAASAAGGDIGTGLAWVKVGFCSSGGRLVPGVGGSVAACFLYIASRLRLQHVVLPAACRRLHKPAADMQVVEKHRTQSNRPPQIWQACNPCTGIATVKFHVGYFIVPVRAHQVFFCINAALDGGSIGAPRGPCKDPVLLPHAP